MNYLQSIIAYLCHYYPHSGELSKARVTKLVYLADWFSALLLERQMTNTRWLFNHYGPYVDDVIDSVRNCHECAILNQENFYGDSKQVIVFRGDPRQISLETEDSQILDWIINKTQSMYFNEFIDFVYSTYPVTNTERYSSFDLVSLAREYRQSLPH